ncbi:MAG: glycerate kinase [Bacteroidales bacterium]|nr:glycerate kinase [Bacteroidales bacterium]
MKIVLAPDSFKGCLSADEVAATMASALRELHPDWKIVELPLADGGEGTVDVVISALEGKLLKAEVSDPLGRQVSARYGLCGELAVVEVAEACGLKHLAPEERNPLSATTRGVGELLLAAREQGASRFLIGLGGTATCDGGVGMMSVPGLQEALEGCRLELLCDVDNPFVGPRGAARIFAPQKGASPADVEILEERMASIAQTMLAETGKDVRDMPGAGAAGGLGGAFRAYFDAASVSGIDRILDLVGFDSIVQGADLIVTGEGKSDLQTLGGKVPYGVLRRAHNVPVILVSGRIEDVEALREAGFSKIIQVSPENLSAEEATQKLVAIANLRHAIFALVGGINFIG